MASFYAMPRGSWLSAADLEEEVGEEEGAEEERQEEENGGAAYEEGGDAVVAATQGSAVAPQGYPSTCRASVSTPASGTNGAGLAAAPFVTSSTASASIWRASSGPEAATANGAPSSGREGVPQGVPLTLYGKSVRRANLQGVDASNELNSATSAQYRIKRSLLQAANAEELLVVVERSLSEFDPFICTLAVHRLARHGKAWRPGAVLRHTQWPRLLEKLRGTVRSGEPRHLASTAWALAQLSARDCELLDPIAEQCIQRVPGSWDPMSLSLVIQSFASLAAQHPKLVASISAQVQSEMSSVWNPSDVARVTWACAKLLHRDDGFFRDASCKALARMPETTPTVLVQTVWAFATVAPASVTSHFFPHAAEAMTASGMAEYTAAHLAMVAWSFAAVLYRPVPLLEVIGDAVPLKGEQMNSQDITMVAWSYATLLAPERRVFDFLSAAAVRSIQNFNAQDLSNTAWAFATAGANATEMMNAIADEACSRPRDFNCQHVAMLFWAFITLKHRHDRLFTVIGELARVDQSSWHSAKLFAYALAGLPRLQAALGSEAATLRVAAQLVDAMEARARKGDGEPDDVVTIHDAVYPWLEAIERGAGQMDVATWRELDQRVGQHREHLQALTLAPMFDAILAIEWWVYDEPTIREYQGAVQALGLRGLGSVHTWRLLRDIGLGRAAQAELAARGAAARAQDGGNAGSGGRGERANFCFWRASVEVPDGCGGSHRVEESGRLQNSSVVGYREDCGGLVAVKLSHDHVSHRAWDAEFRAMARVAAAARALLAGQSAARAQALIDTGASEDGSGGLVAGRQLPRSARERSDLEGQVRGRLEIYMTEVPCLSCVCAMAQFRRRFLAIALEVAWDGMPCQA
mmetsp:Transcript_3647/g.13394  ORF Transcript_3647/g.13394 Transcript_3647/m.13394 type:complete len:867 (+) Transcript_3647:204-2804(+)